MSAFRIAFPQSLRAQITRPAPAALRYVPAAVRAMSGSSTAANAESSPVASTSTSGAASAPASSSSSTPPPIVPSTVPASSPLVSSASASASVSADGSSSAEASTEASTATGPRAVRYPYFVSRSSGGMLPVYSDIKSQGSRIFTVLRRIEGDVQALRHDLLSTLPFPSTDPMLSPFGKPIARKPHRQRAGRRRPMSGASPVRALHPSGTIKIEGDRVREVKSWLKERGF